MTGHTDRRGFLSALAAVGAASAGCLSSGSDSAPSYTNWLPATDDGFFFSYRETGITKEIDDGGSLLPVLNPLPSGGGERPVQLPDELDSIDDPLFALPFRVGGIAFLGAGVSFARSGLGGLLDRGDGEMLSEVFVLDDVVMGTGAFDTDELDRRLREAGEFSSAYEFVEESNGYRHYELPGNPETGIVVNNTPVTVAVSERRIVLGRERDGLMTLLETVSGERDRAVDQLDGFDQLVDNTGDGGIVVGWYGFADSGGEVVGDRQSIPGGLGPNEDVLTAARFAPEGDEITVELTAQDDSLSADRRETLETVFGPGNETSVSLDDGRFSASGTYNEIPFDPVGTDPTDDLPSGEELPPEIREAVPEGAIEIRAVPESDRYQVRVTEPVAVDELKVLAVESDWESTVPNPGNQAGVTFPVDPDSDEIRVIATVDGVSGIVATESVP